MVYFNSTIFKSNHVTKFVFETDDICIESVLYEYQDRTVICISTQCGCPVGCHFCGTGAKFIRNLTTGEIVTQVIDVLATTIPQSKFQIMFMSMGEPFLNYDNVKGAIKALHKLYPKAELLISTMAPVAMLRHWNSFLALSLEIDKVGLQISMHSMDEYYRDFVIPFEEKLDVGIIISKAAEWNSVTKRRVYMNFIVEEATYKRIVREIHTALINGGEDIFHLTFSVKCAKDKTEYKPFNYDIYDYINLKLDQFETSIFNPEGQDDIGAGCGQLWYVQEWMAKHE